MSIEFITSFVRLIGSADKFNLRVSISYTGPAYRSSKPDLVKTYSKIFRLYAIRTTINVSRDNSGNLVSGKSLPPSLAVWLFRERNVHFQSSFEDFSEALQINIERLFLYSWIKTSGVFPNRTRLALKALQSRKTKTQGIWKHWNFKSPQRKERSHRNSSAIWKVKWIIQTYLPLSYLSIDARGALQEQLPGSELTSLMCSKPEWCGLLYNSVLNRTSYKTDVLASFWTR